MKIDWYDSKKYFFTDESVKRQITDSISENLTDSDLDSMFSNYYILQIITIYYFLPNIKATVIRPLSTVFIWKSHTAAGRIKPVLVQLIAAFM